MTRAFIAAVLLLAACATPAPTRDASAATDASKPAAKPARRVECRREALTGSHITGRVCRPVEDADRERATQVELHRPRVSEPPKE